MSRDSSYELQLDAALAEGGTERFVERLRRQQGDVPLVETEERRGYEDSILAVAAIGRPLKQVRPPRCGSRQGLSI